MRHYKKGRKLGTDTSHTKAMKRSLVIALLLNDRIKTIESRAKEIRPDVDKIITWAKKGDLHSRRLAIAALGGDKELVREVFEKVAQGMFQDRPGGYTRIMKLGPRKGDRAPMVIMEMVTEPVKSKEEAKPAAKKAAPKKVEKADEVKEAAEDLKATEEAIVAEAEASVEAADAEGKVEEAVEAAETAAEAEEAVAAADKAEVAAEEKKAE
ncbi:MAG: 50S ribosomal protein L17 [Gordonibacter sp.]